MSDSTYTAKDFASEMRSDAYFAEADLMCDLCRMRLSEHAACRVCETLLHEKTNTDVEHAHRTCARCLPIEERALISWARDAAIFLHHLRISGNVDPARQGVLNYLSARASSIGLDGAALLWERQHVFDSASSVVSSPRVELGAVPAAAPTLEDA